MERRLVSTLGAMSKAEYKALMGMSEYELERKVKVLAGRVEGIRDGLKMLVVKNENIRVGFVSMIEKIEALPQIKQPVDKDELLDCLSAHAGSIVIYNAIFADTSASRNNPLTAMFNEFFEIIKAEFPQ